MSLKSAISPRPAAWILERSFDGVDFFPWQYFGMNDDDCRKRYNLRGQNEPYTFESDDQIICSTEFAKAVPLENGEVSFVSFRFVLFAIRLFNSICLLFLILLRSLTA